jgi:NADH-quinone oxidoreductase subunit L
MTSNLNLWLIPVLPLAGAAINGFLGKKSSRAAVSTVGLLFSGAAFAWAVSVALRFSSLTQIPYQEYVAHWIRSGTFTVDFTLYLDQLSLVMLLVVTGVGFLIHIYSVGYMWDDPSYYRFFSYLNLFMFFMLTLILANNYLMMFIGWEGVGLASYLLIGFWFTKDSAASAGKKAFIVNRIGDFGFLIGIFLIIQHLGSLNFTEVFAKVQPLAAETSSAGLLTAIGILLMVGACGKSAQIPLYVWLPDAMEGPTPVSALIHAATMVTAGVYMVSRSHLIFARAPMALMVVAVIGTLTALFAATIGITQTDIKKVLAYSTVSQLGYMFMACGVGAFSAGIFHLMTHAFFKGLLFLAAGSVIHAVGGEQDMRKMGGLRTYLPWTFLTMGIATLAIAGIPPLAGFWSKDEILWKAFSSEHGSWVFWLIGVITAFITSFYMFRLLFMTFFGNYHGAQIDEHGHGTHGHDGHGHGEPHESPMVMLVPLMILAILSIVGGLVGIGNRFEHFLAPAYVLYVSRPYLPQKIADALGGFYEAVLNKYYFDELYAKLLVKPLLDGSTLVLWKGVDRKVIDDTVNNAADGARHVSDEVRHMQSGNLRSYAGWIAAGSALVIAYMIWLGVGR